MIPKIDVFIGSEFVFDGLFPESKEKVWRNWKKNAGKYLHQDRRSLCSLSARKAV
mgnify:CR=1 FL=1